MDSKGFARQLDAFMAKNVNEYTEKKYKQIVDDESYKAAHGNLRYWDEEGTSYAYSTRIADESRYQQSPWPDLEHIQPAHVHRP